MATPSTRRRSLIFTTEKMKNVICALAEDEAGFHNSHALEAYVESAALPTDPALKAAVIRLYDPADPDYGIAECLADAYTAIAESGEKLPAAIAQALFDFGKSLASPARMALGKYGQLRNGLEEPLSRCLEVGAELEDLLQAEYSKSSSREDFWRDEGEIQKRLYFIKEILMDLEEAPGYVHPVVFYMSMDDYWPLLKSRPEMYSFLSCLVRLYDPETVRDVPETRSSLVDILRRLSRAWDSLAPEITEDDRQLKCLGYAVLQALNGKWNWVDISPVLANTCHQLGLFDFSEDERVEYDAEVSRQMTPP